MQDIGTQFHIRCNPEDIGRYCFLPGDPGRCEAIASCFDDPVHVGMNREYCSFFRNYQKQGALFDI